MVKTCVKDCVIFETTKHRDHRGFFCEIYKGKPHPAQVNWSYSHRNALRGMHAAPYGKLVTCVQGRVFDVCADVRAGSKSKGCHVAVELSAANGRQLYVPPHCAHGFLALDETNAVIYLQDAPHDPEAEICIRFDSLGIQWPLGDYLLSDKDKDAEIWRGKCRT